jgi:hypothetical protein
MCGDAENVYSAVGVLNDCEAVQLASSTVSQWKKSQARIPCAWLRRNSVQVGPERRGDGSIPALLRIVQTVEAPT